MKCLEGETDNPEPIYLVRGSHQPAPINPSGHLFKHSRHCYHHQDTANLSICEAKPLVNSDWLNNQRIFQICIYTIIYFAQALSSGETSTLNDISYSNGHWYLIFNNQLSWEFLTCRTRFGEINHCERTYFPTGQTAEKWILQIFKSSKLHSELLNLIFTTTNHK